MVILNKKQWNKFNTILDAPAKSMPQLKKTF